MTAPARRRRPIRIAAFALIMLGGRPARAQTSCTFTNTAPCAFTLNVSLTPASVMRLTLSTTSTTFSTPVEADYAAGFIEAPGPVATAKANHDYSVTVDAATPFWAYSPVGSLADPTKPAADLRWATAAAGAFTRNMGTAATLLTGSATAGTAQAIFFRATLAYAADPPGTYTLTVRYTLSAP